MPFATNIKNSKLMKDDRLVDIIQQMMGLDLGQDIRLPFNSQQEMLSTERKIRAILEGLGRREDFKLGRKKNFILVIDPKVKEDNQVTLKREEQ